MSRAFGAMAILLTVMVTFGQAVDKAAVKCSTGKQKAAVKKIGSKLKCHQKANAAGLPVDQACLAKARRSSATPSRRSTRRAAASSSATRR